PGIAIARALVKARPSIEPFFVGAQRGIERDVLPKTEFPHILLDLHPLYRSAVWNNWKTLAGAISAWRRIGAVVARERPRLVVGTGGYAAGVMMAYAVAHRIPLVQQVGDSHPGLTARLFSRWSREIYVNFPESASVLRTREPRAIIDTGAPIEPPPVPLPNREEARRHWNFPPRGGSVLLVYGGSQGSLAINRAMASWIEHGLPSDLYVIWSTGRGTHADFARYESERVRVRDYLAPVGDAYAAADLALARAGAMTTAELFAWGIPAVLVPLPTAAADHQTHNAATLDRAGAAIHVPQTELTPQRLETTIRGVLERPEELERLSKGAAKRARPYAAEEIARRILALIDA
ncbi:MAG TPA: glycosyltransferase, partial [Gemmatimonadaceae bacterium]